MKRDAYARVRKICMAFPEVVEKPMGGHEAPAFRVRDKIFVFCSSLVTSDNLGKGRPAISVKGAPGAQDAYIGSDPDRFFVPPYSGPKGWIGAYLDVDPDWDEVAELIEESYRLIAPKRLVAQLDAGEDSRSSRR